LPENFLSAKAAAEYLLRVCSETSAQTYDQTEVPKQRQLNFAEAIQATLSTKARFVTNLVFAPTLQGRV
jgi:hypothetical protein